MPDYTKITTTEAKSAAKALIKEAVQVSPSSVISMFEIDLSDILEDNQFIFSYFCTIKTTQICLYFSFGTDYDINRVVVILGH